jgi:hypothetical protein
VNETLLPLQDGLAIVIPVPPESVYVDPRVLVEESYVNDPLISGWFPTDESKVCSAMSSPLSIDIQFLE